MTTRARCTATSIAWALLLGMTGSPLAAERGGAEQVPRDRALLHEEGIWKRATIFNHRTGAYESRWVYDGVDRSALRSDPERADSTKGDRQDRNRNDREDRGESSRGSRAGRSPQSAEAWWLPYDEATDYDDWEGGVVEGWTFGQDEHYSWYDGYGDGWDFRTWQDAEGGRARGTAP